MARRSTPQKKTDDLAFPIRVKLRIPPTGFGTALTHMHQWLGTEIGPHGYANHSSGHSIAFYFRALDDARAFLRAFPQLELADGTLSPAYSRLGNQVSWSSEDFRKHPIETTLRFQAAA